MIGNRHSRRMLGRGSAYLREFHMPSLQQAAFIALALVAMAIQTLVVQTHIHRQTLTGSSISAFAAVVDNQASAAFTSADRQDLPRDQFPGNDDPGNCPLCQGFAHSGQFIHSGAALAYIPAWVSVHFIVFSDVLPALLSVSHSWQGRAPPQN
jgi:hypothetical protein